MASRKGIRRTLGGILALFVVLLLFGEGDMSEPVPIPEYVPDASGTPKNSFGIVLWHIGNVVDRNEATLNDAIVKAKDGGFDTLIWTGNWGDFEPRLGEYDWMLLDLLVDQTKANGFKFSMSLELAHIADNYHYPDGIDFRDYDDPEFVNGFTAFASELATRYRGRIDYLWIGQEVDFYLFTHPDRKNSLIALFREFEREVKAIDSNVTIGFVGGYHLALEVGTMDILRELAEEGDMIALTLYPEPANLIPDQSRTVEFFDTVVQHFPGRKIFLHETAWSTRGEHGSDAKQVEYIRQLSSVLDKYPDKFEVLSYWLLHDFSESDNRAGLAQYDQTGGDAARWSGSAGLFNSDGTPKDGWRAWKDHMLQR